MPTSLVALGSNVGDRAHSLDCAIRLLAETPGMESVACSSYREYRAIGGPGGQGDFLNAAALLTTSLTAAELHRALVAIERQVGRRPGPRWSERVLDLDLLLYDRQVLDSPELTIPHSRMAWRRFVLEPAAEVAGAMLHPTSEWTVAELSQRLDSTPNYVALCGPPGAGKSALAARLAAASGAKLIADWGLPLEEPSGSRIAREIQLLDRRAALISAAVGTETLTISDFYWDQSLAYARLEIAEVDRAQFEDAWEQQRANVAQPRLLVMLSDRQPCEKSDSRLTRELLSLARRPRQVPVLYAPNDPIAQFDEILAAIQAMQ